MTIGVGLVLTGGCVAVGKWKDDRAAKQEKIQQEAKISSAIAEIQKVNAALPDPQVQAKTLIFTAMIQRKIPATARWCETLNGDGKIWPTTPTNTLFALNAAVAGQVYSKTNRLAGDVVVFFETANPGWNLAGDATLLARGPAGAAVALADGRAMIVPASEASKLRWQP